MVKHSICYSHKFLKQPTTPEIALHMVRKINGDIPVECDIHCSNFNFSPYMPHMWTFNWEVSDSG